MQATPILKGESLKRLLQGVAIGAVMTMAIGFYWAGWKLGSTASEMAQKRSSAAVVAVLAPICVDKFQNATDSSSTLARGGIVFPSDLTILAHRNLVTAALTKHRVPAIFSDEAYTSAGALVAYTADRTEMFRRGASYVARLLRGEAVADLPVVQPTRYKLIINLSAAKGLGIEVPLALQAQADEVIE